MYISLISVYVHKNDIHINNNTLHHIRKHVREPFTISHVQYFIRVTIVDFIRILVTIGMLNLFLETQKYILIYLHFLSFYNPDTVQSIAAT